MSYQEIIEFWFEELPPQDWFKKDDNLDQKIKDRFSKHHQQAISGELYKWRVDPLGSLAEIIIIDQFSRNIFRDHLKSFLYDPLSLTLSQFVIEKKQDQNLSNNQKAFLYMPFMHSESKLIHKIAIELFSKPGLEYHLEFELKHKKIIDRFNRYLHRNEVLGRISTPQEIEFLKTPESSF
jgi:uncharacterized protein (DUF924 family)